MGPAMHGTLGLSLMSAPVSPLAVASARPVRRCSEVRPSAAILLAVVLSGLFTAVDAQAEKRFTGVVTHVSDGDTLWVLPDSGGAPRKVRLDGVDAPELCQRGGLASRRALEQAALNHPVQVQVRRRDDFEREVARVHVDGQDLGARLVREGQAWSYRWRRSAGPYAVEEEQARLARRGLFVEAQPERPRDFRRRHGPCPTPTR